MAPRRRVAPALRGAPSRTARDRKVRTRARAAMAPRFVEAQATALDRGVELIATSLPAWSFSDAVGLVRQRALLLHQHLLAVDGESEGAGQDESKTDDVTEVCRHGGGVDGPQRNACSASTPPRWFPYSRSPPPLPAWRKTSGSGDGEEASMDEAEAAGEAAGEAASEASMETRRRKQSLTRTANAMLAAGAFMGAVYAAVLRKRAKQMHGSVKWRHE